MTALTESTLREMTSIIGKELLVELSCAPWGNPLLKSIEKFGFAIGTNTGLQRDRNEDRVAVAQITTHCGEQFAAALVCDGVGGSEMGDVAATLAIATFLEALMQSAARVPISQLLVELVRKMDDAVRSALGGRGTTTASVLLASATGRVVAANVGDSRIFSWKPGGSCFRQVSVDDTMENELRNLPVDSSVLDARGLRGRLSQAIGEAGRSSNDLRVVVIDEDQFMKSGVVLATDGAWKSDEIGFQSVVLHATSTSDVLKRVLSLSTWTGGVDNVSVVAIEDVQRFAKLSENLVHRGSHAAWATVWICDTKLVMCDAGGPGRRKPEDRPKMQKSPHDNDKAVRKSQSRKKTPAALPNQDARQLDLTAGSTNHERPIEPRPKIEISTDDDAPKTQ